ncbi:MAG: MFS transporter [Alphaproteobacteria bacterium]|nr:MFS transporter [Alphaproteobacteria bacterium]
MTVKTISRKSLLQYGFIGLPMAFAGFPLYIFAPDFYATNHGVSLTLLGGLLLAIRLFDAVQDPLIGWLVDRLRGKFMPLLTSAGIILCISIFGLFNSLLFSPPVWFSLCMLFAVSAYSILTIILGVRATLWTIDKEDQTRISGARESFGITGLIIAVSMPTLLSRLVTPNRVYLLYTGVLSILMLGGIYSFSKLYFKPISIATAHKRNHFSLLPALRTLPKQSLKLFAVYSLSMLASSFSAALVIFYVRDLLGAENLTGLFLILYFSSGAAAMPLWKSLSVRIGKYKTWALSNIVAVVSFIGAFFLNVGDVWPYAIVCSLSGLALGADLMLPPSILSDHIHGTGNKAFSGTYYAFLPFISKASLALASAIALPTLEVAGFKPQTINSDPALIALSVTYAIIPCLLKIMATGLLYGFFIRFNIGENNEGIQNHSNTRSSNYV